MPKYRKKPVEIEAFRFTIPIEGDMPRWLHQAMQDGTVVFHGGEDPHLIIQALEGDHRANRRDWLIQGVQGEIYPCKPDIFQATYEPVDEEADEEQ